MYHYAFHLCYMALQAYKLFNDIISNAILKTLKILYEKGSFFRDSILMIDEMYL